MVFGMVLFFVGAHDTSGSHFEFLLKNNFDKIIQNNDIFCSIFLSKKAFLARSGHNTVTTLAATVEDTHQCEEWRMNENNNSQYYNYKTPLYNNRTLSSLNSNLNQVESRL